LTTPIPKPIPKPIPTELLQRLPKTDLHLHLDGSLRVRTLLDLAREHGVALPADDVEGLRPHLAPRGGDLPAYLSIFDLTLSVLDTAASLERVAFELAEDAARENVRYCEIRYSPILHRKRGLSLEEIVEAVLRGLRRAEAEHPIRCGVILCGIRQIGPDISLRLADLAIAYKHRGVVGFDLAGAEKDYPAKEHREAFVRILEANINVTVHAGEAFGAASIRQALHYGGAHRIGHGTRLREDPDLLDYVNDHRVPLEMCLTSNVQTGAVARLEDHPFGEYVRRGLRVTLNTDNRLISDTDSTRELILAAQTFQLTPEEVRKVLINGFKSAFLPHDEKIQLLRSVVAEMDDLFREWIPQWRPERTFL